MKDSDQATCIYCKQVIPIEDIDEEALRKISIQLLWHNRCALKSETLEFIKENKRIAIDQLAKLADCDENLMTEIIAELALENKISFTHDGYQLVGGVAS